MRYSKMYLIFGLLFIIGVTDLAWSRHKLTLQFKNMTPHTGKMLQVIVKNKATGEQVGRATVHSIPGANFEVNLYVIIDGHSYWIDFYADHNGNKHYDPPPTDHAWRLEINNAQDDTILTFTHNLNFTDIQYPPLLDPAQYSGTWKGNWTNLTFNTKGPIEAIVTMDTSLKTFQLIITTTGSFGIPDTVTYIFNGPLTTDKDSVQLTVPPPWTGSVILAPGQINGTIVVPAFGITMTIAGNFGPSQAIFSYEMTGAFQANGVAVFTKEKETLVEYRTPEKQPKYYALYQNYPNPFNQATLIQFELKEPTRVVLKVYDLLGKEITKIVDENFIPGLYKVPFDATGLSSGTYFYSIQMGNSHFVKKMSFIE